MHSWKPLLLSIISFKPKGFSNIHEWFTQVNYAFIRCKICSVKLHRSNTSNFRKIKTILLWWMTDIISKCWVCSQKVQAVDLCSLTVSLKIISSIAKTFHQNLSSNNFIKILPRQNEDYCNQTFKGPLERTWHEKSAYIVLRKVHFTILFIRSRSHPRIF